MDDLISRKELFSEMLQFRQKIMNHENPIQQRLPNWNDAVSLIGSAPAADAVLVEHGKWQEYHATARGYGKIYYQHSCTPLLYDSPYYYCPNCGAKMERCKRQMESSAESTGGGST